MHQVSGLYRQVKPVEPPRRSQVNRAEIEEREAEAERKRKEEKAAKEEAKLKAKQEKERLKLEEEAKRKKAKERTRTGTRKPFNFEEVCFIFVVFVKCCLIHLHKERPKVLNAIAEGSSAANNLINAITVHPPSWFS